MLSVPVSWQQVVRDALAVGLERARAAGTLQKLGRCPAWRGMRCAAMRRGAERVSSCPELSACLLPGLCASQWCSWRSLPPLQSRAVIL